MAIFRGVGGSGDSSDNSFLDSVTAQANAASASATSAANSLAAIQETEVTSASFDTSDGVLTLTKTGGATVTADLDGRFLTSYTETNDLSTAVTWANVPDANITQSSVTQHQAALSITESQISDLQTYLTAETNDLSTSVTWANVPDANITQSSVTQHQAALSITESQISDLQSYLTSFDITTQTDPKYLRADANDTTTGTITADGGFSTSTGHFATSTGNITSSYGSITVGGLVSAPNINIHTEGSVTTNIATGITGSESSPTKIINIGTGYSTGGTTTVNICPTSGLTTKNINLNGNVAVSGTVDGRDVATDGSKLDSIKKRTFGNTSPISITTTSPVTIFEGGIAAPNVNALQTMTARFHLRVGNSSTSNKINNQYYLTKFLYSKGTSGVSIGTGTYDSSPSPYNAWYYVSGDKTDIIVPNRGRMATSSAGASSGQVLGSYYDSTNDRTYFRITKFPDATTVYNNVTVYYSVDGFVSSGSYVANNNNYNSRYFSLLAKSLSTNTHQSPDIAIEDSFGRSSTATKFKIEIDFITSLSNLVVIVYDFMGHTEVSP